MGAKLTPEQIVIEAWVGCKEEHPVFKGWSDDTFIGYATGVTKLSNPTMRVSTIEWEKLIRKMLKERRI